jgi:transcriptional regulator with XRE-family HTH domain
MERVKLENTSRRADVVDIYVAGQVKALRSLRGMSQQELAFHTGVTFQQIQKYEKGINRLSAARIHQIADVLNTDISVFFPISKDEPKNKGSNNFLDNETILLMKLFQEIKDSDIKDSLLKLLQMNVPQAHQE